jgi:hypothetical protein
MLCLITSFTSFTTQSWGRLRWEILGSIHKKRQVKRTSGGRSLLRISRDFYYSTPTPTLVCIDFIIYRISTISFVLTFIDNKEVIVIIIMLLTLESEQADVNLEKCRNFKLGFYPLVGQAERRERLLEHQRQ